MDGTFGGRRGALTPPYFHDHTATQRQLERSLNDSLLVEGSAFRSEIFQTVTDFRCKMACCKSSEQQLDQTLAKEKTARQAREAAANHILVLDKSREAQRRRTLQQAKEAVAETSRIHAQLAEPDTLHPFGEPCRSFVSHLWNSASSLVCSCQCHWTSALLERDQASSHSALDWTFQVAAR